MLLDIDLRLEECGGAIGSRMGPVVLQRAGGLLKLGPPGRENN